MKSEPQVKSQPLVVITGPTATGKTEVGVLVAEKLGGEVVSADSMLIYRGMDIGTAKPHPWEMRNIPHHLIDIVDPDQEYSVALFQQQARRVIGEILSRRAMPLLVGGTGLYIRAVIDNYDFSGARGNQSLRDKLLKEAQDSGPDLLHLRLTGVDPAAAAKLHPRDVRRVIRALEVYHQTGRPISSYQKAEENLPQYSLFMFGLAMERTMLYRRIEQRVDKMLEAGLVEEVRTLLHRGYSRELNSMRGLGYKEIAAYLSGEATLEQSVELLKRNTRRFAKRQLTWFRRDNRIQWLDLERYGGTEAIAQEITRRLEGVF